MQLSIFHVLETGRWIVFRIARRGSIPLYCIETSRESPHPSGASRTKTVVSEPCSGSRFYRMSSKRRHILGGAARLTYCSLPQFTERCFPLNGRAAIFPLTGRFTICRERLLSCGRRFVIRVKNLFSWQGMTSYHNI